VKDSYGKVLEKKESIKGRYTEYFEDLYNRHNLVSELTTTNQQEFMECFMPEEVESAIKSLKTRKAPQLIELRWK